MAKPDLCNEAERLRLDTRGTKKELRFRILQTRALRWRAETYPDISFGEIDIELADAEEEDDDEEWQLALGGLGAELGEAAAAGKKDKAAGLLVLEGAIRKGLFARLTRQDVIVSATKIASLRRFKDDVDEVRTGLECGVVLEDTNDIKAGDMLEVFSVEERERTL